MLSGFHLIYTCVHEEKVWTDDFLCNLISPGCVSVCLTKLSHHYSEIQVHTALLRLNLDAKTHAHTPCLVRCVTWLFLCVCTVNRPGAFLPRYSSDESLLSWWLTTGVSTSKAHKHTHTHVHAPIIMHKLRCERFMSVHGRTLNTKSLWVLNHRGCKTKYKCKVINGVFSDTEKKRKRKKPSNGRIRLCLSIPTLSWS